MAARPGVAAVVGPSDVTAAEARRLLVAGSGNAVRFAVIESTDPLGASAIGRVRVLREDLPAMARSAGLTGARFEVGGQTAISANAIDALLADLWRVALAIALAASFALLALVPLDQFREIAAAMALGILIDTFIVRSLLVPALVVLTGRAGRWPAREQTRRGLPHIPHPGQHGSGRE